MRKSCFAEIEINRNSHRQYLRSKTQVIEEDKLYIERFDELFGLDKETIKMVNSKIEGVKLMAEINISKLRQGNEKLFMQY